MLRRRRGSEAFGSEESACFPRHRVALVRQQCSVVDSAVLAGISQTTSQTDPLGGTPPSPLSNRGHPVGDGPPPGLAANDE